MNITCLMPHNCIKLIKPHKLMKIHKNVNTKKISSDGISKNKDGTHILVKI